MTLARLFRISQHRLKSVSRKDELDAELGGELAFHFEQLVRENLAEGMTQAEARDTARRELGNIALIEEQCRDQRRLGWLHDLRQDVLYGLRMLRKSPGFTAVAAVSLAIGIGANTAILGAIDSILAGQLPVADPGRIVLLRTFPVANPGQESQASVPDFLAWKEQSHVFDSMGVHLSDQRDFGAEENGAPAERWIGEGVSPGLFETLRVQPILGRLFTDAEDQIDAPAPVILISHQLWQRRFGSDPSVVNRQVRLNGAPVTIIGVMPASFRYPLENLDYWAPIAINRYQLEGSGRLFTVTARLKSGVTIRQAQAEMDAIAAQLARDFPQRHKGWGVHVQSLRAAWFGWLTTPLLTLEGAVGLVLLIACANVAGLLLARGSVRRPEIAMRVALGAGRGRIFRQLLAESVLLSLIGGVLAVFVAWVGAHGMNTLTPPFASQRAINVSLNARTLGLMTLLSLITGVIFGVAPAMAAVKLDLAISLSESGRPSGGPTGHQKLRSALVAIQIAFAFVLLIGAGLLGNSLLRVVSQDLNFDPRGLFTFEFRLPLQSYLRGLGSNRGNPYFEVNPPSQIMNQVYTGLTTLPGVESVGGISLPPVNSILIPSRIAYAQGRPIPQTEADREALRVTYFLVTPNAFATMKARLVRGREFTDRDTVSTPWSAVINESMAHRFWPGEDPIGKSLTLEVVSGEQPREVIGVVADIPLSRKQSGPEPVLYTSYLQQAPLYRGPSGNVFGVMTFMLRTSRDPGSLTAAVRKAVTELDPNRSISNIATMEELTGAGLRDRRTYVLGLSLFACVATLLAAIGIYGLMAYSVAQRTREIGIRMALGAGARQVIAGVGGRALLSIATGLGLGLVGSISLTHLLASQLWGVTPTDPATFIAVSTLFAAVALLAFWVPARRATKVDPGLTLRT